ncbi:probable leucine-rich repeat receptor-like serine/threonine-protein kinase At3g14840 [Momordica charantia]|uniref:non-specific serine/threonine protein kinase n=1 Tax=Momordica charantia TaxID=3673 RepID=A0A6J1BZ22_MOMCH|nr:probable leucine-rich repeat receptor-like serine/threonine-protein kinase At3g14840 [Momordica charantia]
MLAARNTIIASFLILCSVPSLAFGSPLLPPDEVEGLRYVGKTLGKRDWNFSADPCSGQFGWVSQNGGVPEFRNNVTCNCTFLNATVCHVTHIILNSQSLPGTLPSQLFKLPYLEVLDLAWNYLSGEIPPEWGSTKLLELVLLGNRLTGSIPDGIGNITTLRTLNLEINNLSGRLPSTLGNLLNLEKLLLGSNNFTGRLPTSLGMLTSLITFRINDNNFEEQIPSFIQNWKNIERIRIQGSGLSGPIPSEIGLLTKLTDLRISDLNGASSPFPPLKNLTNISYLVLRSCNIIGVLPEFLAGMTTTLKLLDLSFNRISGQIPTWFRSLQKADNIFLTGNLLNGSVPDWMLFSGKSIDLSYNKFKPPSTDCQSRNTNLFASSASDNNSNIVSCLADHTCPKKVYSLHINCGGKEEVINGTKFDWDEDTGKVFVSSNTNWAFSNTGIFLDDSRIKDTRISVNYLETNSSKLPMVDSKLYETARISPMTLTYYVYCMGNGNYTISLHFAEITITNDQTFNSLGRRIFDIYVQGRLVLKDFNIVDAAGGAGKPVTKKISIPVTSNTIDIRFYWAGKGTFSILYGGVYGPLISAISLEPDFDPPSEGRSALPVGAILGIVAAIVLGIVSVLGILWWRCCLGWKSTLHHDLKGLDLQTGSFTLRQIKAATNNFDDSNKIGEGGFGPVYKGFLLDGTMIAVKQLSPKSRQGMHEFVNEIGMISALHHPNLVKLYGCCIEGNQLLLVYEYMENNCLARAMFGPEDTQLRLDWPTRQKICIGIAKGLAYLHEESRLKIVHRDIKATNVLLDKNLDPKISDFGLAKLEEEGETHISTQVAGTFGYIAPEYATRGHLSDKADVYSFGIVALEIVSGRSNTSHRSKDDCFYLLDWALELKEKDSLIELVDPRLGSNFNHRVAMAMINIALHCTNVSPSERPAMSSVVSMLEGKVAVKELVSHPNDTRTEMSAMWTLLLQQSQKQTDNEKQTEVICMDMPSNNSSINYSQTASQRT